MPAGRIGSNYYPGEISINYQIYCRITRKIISCKRYFIRPNDVQSRNIALDGNYIRNRSDQMLHHGIVQPGAKGFDAVVGSGRMDTIGQKNYNNLTLQVHPERSSRKAEMSDAFF